ncbi:MAG: hypothetical protein VKK98_01545 [Cyanobacteriota bacterium]|nr:hypothetical protein [Cyanobacteriota bacterium]
MLAGLEAISRDRPDRVLRLRGHLPVDPNGYPRAGGERSEPFELLVFRGFSSSVTHPTAVDPDVSVLPEGSTINGAELLRGPLTAEPEQPITEALPVSAFLDPAAWC